MKVQKVKNSSPQWPLGLLAVLLSLGFGIATTLTWHHENHLYGDASVHLKYCSETALVSCDLVNSSEYSELFGIPIALFALPFYLVLLGLILFRQKNPSALAWVFWGGGVASGISLLLAGISYFKIGYFCLWCVGLYAINFSIPLLVGWAKDPKSPSLFRWSALFSKEGIQCARGVGAVFLVLLGVSLFAQKKFRSGFRSSGETASRINRGDRFVLPGALYRPVFSEASKKISLEETRLSDQVGRGQWLALLYVMPGVPDSDLFSVKAAELFRRLAPEGHLVLVTPIQSQQRLEEYWENQVQFKELQHLPLLFDQNFQVGRKLAVTYPPSLVLVDPKGIVVAQGMSTLENLENFLKGLPEKTGEVSDGMPLDRSSELVGKCAPAFHLNNLVTREPVSISFPKKSKKPTLLFFWNALCRHCQEEVPRLLSLYQKHPTSVDIVTVSRIRPGNHGGRSHREQTLDYMKQVKFPWPVLVDSGLVSFLYGVNSTPTSIVIAPNGVIQKVWRGESQELSQYFENVPLSPEPQNTVLCSDQEKLPQGSLDFSVLDASGSAFPIQKKIQGPTLVHLWSPSCVSCREELKEFLAFSKEVAQKGLQTILVSVEKPENAHQAQAVLRELGHTKETFFYPHEGLYQQIDAAYNIPRTYLIDAQARILTKYVGPQDWNETTFKELVFTWIQ